MCTCKVGSREEQYNNVYYRLVISGNLLLARKLFQKPVELLVTPLFCLFDHGFIYFTFFRDLCNSFQIHFNRKIAGSFLCISNYVIKLLTKLRQK